MNFVETKQRLKSNVGYSALQRLSLLAMLVRNGSLLAMLVGNGKSVMARFRRKPLGHNAHPNSYLKRLEKNQDILLKL